MIGIYKDEILSFAEASLGGDGGKKDILSALCEAASAELMGRLKEGVETESIKPLFVTAAGVLALSMFVALDDCGSYTFKAGNLSVSSAGGAVSAHTLRKQAEAILSAYMADRGFEFRSVEG